MTTADLQKNASRPSPFPADLDPRTTPPGLLVQRLILEGRLPFAEVFYPRLNAQDQPICKVYVRLLTAGEQDRALANARLHVERLLAGGKKEQALDWRPEELEHNARVTEFLAIACRDPADPAKPFFEHGVIDVREYCTSEELGVLANVYAGLNSKRPHLGNLTDADMEAFLRAVEVGAIEHPFSLCSREDLETLLAFAVRSWGGKGATSTGPQPTSSS